MPYYPAEIIIEVETNLDTGLYVCPLRHQTILEVKGLVEDMHVQLFPEHGEIHVKNVKAVLPEGKVTLENGDIIGNVYTKWSGKIIIRAGKRKNDASHATGPNASLLPTKNSKKETAREYDPANATGSDPSMSQPEALMDPAGEHDTFHGMDPDVNISDQELQLREPPKRSKPSTVTANCSKAREIVRLPNSSEKTEDGNAVFHATNPNFYDGHIHQKSPVPGPVQGSTIPTEMIKLSNSGESSLVPSGLQKRFPTSVSLATNWLSCKSSGDANKSRMTCKTCGSLVRFSKQSTRPLVEAKKFHKSREAALRPSNLPGSVPKSASLTPKLKRSPSTRVLVTGPGTSAVRADTTKAFWDFWETFKQRRLKMVAYVPTHPTKSPKGAKRRVTGPKTLKRPGVSQRS